MNEQQQFSELVKAGVIFPKKIYPVNEQHRAVVEAGGGVYVSGMMGNLVLFNSPQTGSTLAVAEKDLTPEAVRARIIESDEAFGVHPNA